MLAVVPTLDQWWHDAWVALISSSSCSGVRSGVSSSVQTMLKRSTANLRSCSWLSSAAMAWTLHDPVPHPDVRLPVAARIRSAVDLERREPAREDVLAALRERRLGPFLPLGDRAGDAERLGLRPQDLRSEPLVDPHPGVEEKPVVAPPGCVALDRRERVAQLPARAHGRDQRTEAVRTRDVAHRLDAEAAQPSALEPGRNHD